MQFLHWEFDIGPENTVMVTLDQQANVFLVDNINFQNYRSGRDFRYYGGLQTRSPVYLTPPRDDHWHLIINLGGASGTIRHSVNVI
jgi:Domain of unknown function (DUF1883)